MTFAGINYWAVLVAAAVGFGFGGVWYGGHWLGTLLLMGAIIGTWGSDLIPPLQGEG